MRDCINKKRNSIVFQPQYHFFSVAPSATDFQYEPDITCREIEYYTSTKLELDDLLRFKGLFLINVYIKLKS